MDIFFTPLQKICFFYDSASFMEKGIRYESFRGVFVYAPLHKEYASFLLCYKSSNGVATSTGWFDILNDLLSLSENDVLADKMDNLGTHYQGCTVWRFRAFGIGWNFNTKYQKKGVWFVKS